ncbi:amidohydrolase [Shewanella litorisediminis]|uniref:Amidohydrolase n=1 Tax=Shewanella litorisediminis TaxID=1173586 RepID=A0ABX7G2E5_9GAMM|nr:amidohydrolase [Shewanella litorisediminis]MCL2918513.1 amidohydrolase [Shewanella litorisediminis]QRH01343.1 amidohydrolase [Shewanella litorisediminis]
MVAHRSLHTGSRSLNSLPRRTLLASLLLFCCQGAPTAATIKLENIRGYGFDDERQLVSFDTLAYDDATGKVLARGKEAQSLTTDKVLNGAGKTLLPGLIDGHGHVLGLGQSLSRVELRESRTEAAAASLVSDFARAHPEQRWILGRGWNQELWDSRAYPSKASLDALISDRPVWLQRVDGHAGWANSKALALAGISRDTLDPDGGQIIKDAKGEPTGVLVDNAMALLERHIPEPDKAERLAAFATAFDHLLSLGITATHDAGISAAELGDYQALRQQDKLPVRIYAMLSAADPALDTWLKQGPILDEDERLVARSVKIYSDGALGSRGAALLAPYSDRPGETGLLVTPEPELGSLIKATVAAGFQANVHAIGDRANRMVLDKFAQLDNKTREAGRHRIEHAQIIDPEDLPRFATLKVLPSMQPTHATSDMNMAGDRLGEQRLRGAYAWRTLVDLGSPIVGGSDFPVELANPFHGLHAAVTRQDQRNLPEGGWRPAEKLTLAEALRAFTRDAAYGAFQEQKMGSLTPGSFADFIVLDRDIFAIAPEQLWQTRVLETHVAGKQVYALGQ